MKTADEIFQEMKTLFAEKSGREISDDCDMAVRMYAAAAQTEALYIYGQWITRQCFPQTAEGEYLDSHGAVRGLTRRSAVKAAGELCFSVKTAAEEDISVPSGTVCMTADGVSFVTTADGVIAQGETMCTVKAQAAEAGVKGNAAARTVTYMTHAPVGVESCTNPYGFTGGMEAESDEKFRIRILESFKGLPNGANAAWYEKTALGVEGVTAVSVVPCSRGAGTVDVVIASADGVPTAELIAKVQAVFEEKREICVDVLVTAPNEVHMSIGAEVKVKTGYDANTVLTAVETELLGIFTGSLLGRTLYMAEIADKIYHVPGVESYRLLSPDYDYTAAKNVLLRAGTISVSRWN